MPRCSLRARGPPGQVPPLRAGFIPFRDKSLTGFNATVGFESRYSGTGISNGVYKEIAVW